MKLKFKEIYDEKVGYRLHAEAVSGPYVLSTLKYHKTFGFNPHLNVWVCQTKSILQN